MLFISVSDSVPVPITINEGPGPCRVCAPGFFFGRGLCRAISETCFELGSYRPYPCAANRRGFLIFIFFISVFYKNIFSIWKFTEIYPGRPAAGRPGPGRPAAGRQGLLCKKKEENKLWTDPWEPAARQPGGRPPRPPGWGAAGPHTLI